MRHADQHLRRARLSVSRCRELTGICWGRGLTELRLYQLDRESKLGPHKRFKRNRGPRLPLRLSESLIFLVETGREILTKPKSSQFRDQSGQQAYPVDNAVEQDTLVLGMSAFANSA